MLKKKRTASKLTIRETTGIPCALNKERWYREQDTHKTYWKQEKQDQTGLTYLTRMMELIAKE